MKPVIALLCLLAALILIGCAALTDPVEPAARPDGSSRGLSASPFYDATRSQPSDDLPTWGSRPSKERDAWRARHR